MNTNVPYTEDEVRQVAQMFLDGHTATQITAETGISRTTVYKILRNQHPIAQKLIGKRLVNGRRPPDEWNHEHANPNPS